MVFFFFKGQFNWNFLFHCKNRCVSVLLCFELWPFEVMVKWTKENFADLLNVFIKRSNERKKCFLCCSMVFSGVCFMPDVYFKMHYETSLDKFTPVKKIYGSIKFQYASLKSNPPFIKPFYGTSSFHLITLEVECHFWGFPHLDTLHLLLLNPV